jgi:hypothetical protein
MRGLAQREGQGRAPKYLVTEMRSRNARGRGLDSRSPADLGCTLDVMAPECSLCGVNLQQQDHPLARLLSWPPMFDPGVFTIAHGWSKPLPTRDEMCRLCQAKLGLAAPEAVSRNSSDV